MDILVQCAWCHKKMGVIKSESSISLATNITHSICPTCYDIWISDTECPKSPSNTVDGNHYPNNTIIKNN